MNQDYDAVEFLNNAKTLELISGIHKFRKLTPRIASREEIREQLAHTIPYYLITSQTISNPEFFRVRKNKNKESFKKTSDFWNPMPEDINKQGRLNRAHESVLYLSLDPLTPISEVKIIPGDYFTLMFYRYKTQEKITAMQLSGLPFESMGLLQQAGLTENGLTNYYLLSDFIRTELVRDVEEETTYLYDITNMIKDYLGQSASAFIYPSVYNYKRQNCMLKPEYARSLLSCTGFFYGQLIEYRNDGASAEIKPIARKSDSLNEEEVGDIENFEGNDHVIINMVDDEKTSERKFNLKT